MSNGPMDLNAAIAPGLYGANTTEQALAQALNFCQTQATATVNAALRMALLDPLLV